HDNLSPTSGSVFHTSPIELVREGMSVVDAAGEKVGKVEGLKMGDPEAVTTAGNENRPTDLIGQVVRTWAGDEVEPDLPEPRRSELLRSGFIKVDGPGL